MSTIPDVFPRGVRDPFCSQGHVVETPTDRRMLWNLAHELSAGTTQRQRELGRAAEAYLHATCEHHWHESLTCCDPPDDGCYPPHRQCLWCNTVQWPTGNPDQPWADPPPEVIA